MSGKTVRVYWAAAMLPIALVLGLAGCGSSPHGSVSSLPASGAFRSLVLLPMPGDSGKSATVPEPRVVLLRPVPAGEEVRLPDDGAAPPRR